MRPKLLICPGYVIRHIDQLSLKRAFHIIPLPAIPNQKGNCNCVCQSKCDLHQIELFCSNSTKFALHVQLCAVFCTEAASLNGFIKCWASSTGRQSGDVMPRKWQFGLCDAGGGRGLWSRRNWPESFHLPQPECQSCSRWVNCSVIRHLFAVLTVWLAVYRSLSGDFWAQSGRIILQPSGHGKIRQHHREPICTYFLCFWTLITVLLLYLF